jgi:hypothetical protein
MGQLSAKLSQMVLEPVWQMVPTNNLIDLSAKENMRNIHVVDDFLRLHLKNQNQVY